MGKNLPYLIQHLASVKYDVLLLQALNLSSDKVVNLCGFYYPPIINEVGPLKRVQTAIYIRVGLKYNILQNTHLINMPDIHACSAAIQFCNSNVINFMSVYLPKGPNDQNTEWLRSIGIHHHTKENGSLEGILMRIPHSGKMTAR